MRTQPRTHRHVNVLVLNTEYYRTWNFTLLNDNMPAVTSQRIMLLSIFLVQDIAAKYLLPLPRVQSVKKLTTIVLAFPICLCYQAPDMFTKAAMYNFSTLISCTVQVLYPLLDRGLIISLRSYPIGENFSALPVNYEHFIYITTSPYWNALDHCELYIDTRHIHKFLLKLKLGKFEWKVCFQQIYLHSTS
jgi:hypothetical protein